MSEINNGGPAFPIPLQEGQSYQGHAPCDGMTLRDYFAAKAMQGFMIGLDDFDEEALAESAYRLANAMLRTREVKG
ncbi:hypothetical protein [Pandoraea apista]|uniref:hypothetical protein n=1 Tax=Pandoraea apista TaxID=93218 RepID=UPI002F925AFA